MTPDNRLVRGAGIVLAAALAVTLAGCAGGGGGSAQPNSNRPENEIHIAVYGDAAAAAEEAAAESFNKTSTVKVVVDKLAGDDTYATSVRTSLGTANGPDIFMSWGAADIQQLVDAGAIMSLDNFISQDPKLKDSFIPSVFNGEVIDGKSYGIPMRGVAPTFLFYNKKVLADAGLKPVTSWADFESQTKTLSSKGVIPVALAGADKWPTQMWYQYAFSREIGNEQVAKGLAGDSSVWSSDGSKKALSDLKGLIDAGTFGTTFDSVGYTNQGSTALLSQGKAAYELMGTWNYSVLEGADPTFVANDLGWVAFPSIPGGSGQAGEIAGNLSNYYNVAADTRYPDTVRAFLAQLYSDDFVKAQIGLGNLPPTTNAADLIAADSTIDANKKAYLDFVFKLVQSAPNFQLSWDRAVPSTSKERLTSAVAAFFNGSMDADAWITEVQSLTKVN